MKNKKNSKRLTEFQQMQLIEQENHRKEFLFEAFDDLIEKSREKLRNKNSGCTKFEEFYSATFVATEIADRHLVLALDEDTKIGPVYSIPEVVKYLAVETDHLDLEIGKKDGKWWVWNLISIGSCLEDATNEEGIDYVNFSIHPTMGFHPKVNKNELN